MRFVFILDPLDSLKVYKDTSIAIMREAAKRGHELFVSMQSDVLLRHDQVRLNTRSFQFMEGASWYQLGEAIECNPNEFNAVLMRKDPPFDNEYLYSTYLLELAVKQGANVLNNPESVRGWNEKLSIARFPQFAPEFLVTSNNQLIRDFLAEHGDIILKPLDGMGGSSIYRLTPNDPNISVILETITNFGKRTIMAQRYLAAILEDKRIIIINGEPLPYSLARVPKQGETRGNLAAGGIGRATKLTERDREIAISVGRILKEKGLFLVGLDVIGDYLTEINVTSPTGMVEISAQTKSIEKYVEASAVMIDALEELLTQYKHNPLGIN
jgi:glutathione synthase